MADDNLPAAARGPAPCDAPGFHPWYYAFRTVSMAVACGAFAYGMQGTYTGPRFWWALLFNAIVAGTLTATALCVKDIYRHLQETPGELLKPFGRKASGTHAAAGKDY